MPKRINHIFQKQITFTKLLEAHQKTKKGKRFKKQVIEFEMDLETNLLQIGRELKNGRYNFSKYFEFTIYEPKKKMKRKLKNFQKLYAKDKIETTYIIACINSWLGHARHRNSYHLVNKMFEEFVLRK